LAKDIISDGLAVSYFYNFVKRMFDNIHENSKVKSKNKTYRFSYDKVSLTIIIPSILTTTEIERCQNYVFEKKEARLIIDRGRDMNFFMEDLETPKKNVIDFPTTIGSLIEFFKIDIDNLSGFIAIDTASEKWKEREKLELDKFKEILEFLINNYNTTRGKVKVRYLDQEE